MGYSFGRPIIVKTRAKGWVVLVTSGYNNGTDSSGDGVGYLFVLDARSGDVIQALSTGVGSAADPSGLAQISAYVENGDIDNTTDFVYGGDLKGNLWRFDLSGSTTATWNVKKIATLVDDGSNYQPITTVPELAKIKIGSSYKRLVYVGTGLYLGDTDVPGTTGANAHATQTQTMYALVDDLSTAPTISPLRSNLQVQSVTTAGVFTITAVDYSTMRGWYLNLPTSGERSNTDPVIGLTTLAFTTNVPNSDPCIPGGSSYFYAMDYAYETGRSTPFVTATRISLGSALASRPVLVKTDTGLKAIIRLSDQTTPIKDVPLASSGTTTKRISWRELPEQ
jgi:type IV pilus assembly protein PilY1